MKRIIPILCITIAALCICISVIGLIMICAARNVDGLSFIAVPCIITGTVTSLVSVGFDILFFKDKLCRAALIINAAALVVSIVSLILWLA